MNEFVFASMQRVFVCFLDEIEDSKEAFRNYLTFPYNCCCQIYIGCQCLLYILGIHNFDVAL